MVGVHFWVLHIIIVVNFCTAKPKDCPKVCMCLGTYVDCSSNQFETIPSNIPQWATHLNLQNNSIRKLTDVNWKHYPELKELILNKNNIAAIPQDTLQYQTQLKILELNRNRIKALHALSFKSLANLSSLKLKRNQISEVSDGAFYGLMKIDKLIMDYNHIKVISKRWLYGLDTLKELSLSHNYIHQIDLDSWEFCNSLQMLDLSFNNLQTIDSEAFKNLGHLLKLHLNNNNITNIKENSFVHLPKLKVLNLSNNRISWIVEDANHIFQGLSDLLKFYLTGNSIKSINKDAFEGLRNVTYLNLGNNNITSIQKDAFIHMPLLNDLLINTTSLICDCNLKWFLDFIILKQMKMDSASCAYPEWLRGHTLANITSNLTCDELPKPRLIEEPDANIMALKGENVSLKCKAISSARGEMVFTWKKDNIEISRPDIITSSSDVNGKSTEATSYLNLAQVDNSHAGKYQCVVSNSYGSTYSQKSTISVLVFPAFTKTPKNVTVRVGEMVKWECAANGEPPPEIAWHKAGGNDFPAARERRIQVMPQDDILFIINTKPTDMGIYSCTAHNAAGTVVANASLTIEEKPSFIRKMEDREFIAGEHVVLQCLAKGIPKPTITWYKDGQMIIRTERHFFIHDDQMIIIVDSVKSDSGVYECHLKNSLGEESGRSHIIVKPNTYDASNMLGIVIISVVCCAVLTSIVWVVIIYQTRKRMVPAGTIPPSTPQQTEFHELSEKSRSTQIQMQLFPDNLSDRSSCKDSGTGDSAKRSNDDLAAHEEFAGVGGDGGDTANNSHAPLLHYVRVAAVVQAADAGKAGPSAV
nr:unnamed protein product [Callosobruchus analis]